MIEQTITEMDEVKDKTDIGFMESAGIFLNKLSPFSKEIKALIPKINAELTDINTSVQTATDKADEAEQSATDAKNAKDECENMQVQLEANSVHVAVSKPTPADADEFPLIDSASSFSLKKLTFGSLKTILASLFVGKSDNETLEGVITFSLSPIVPTPTNSTDVTNKLYIDNKPTGFKNIIINGDMRVNQRAFNGNWDTASAHQYGYDRWFKNGTLKAQVVEDINYKKNTVYTISGTGIITTQLTSPASGHWTISVPFSATNIQVEEGTVATPFELRHYGLELSLCQRYYEVVPDFYVSGYNNYHHPNAFPKTFLVAKRVAPTATSMTYHDQPFTTRQVTTTIALNAINVTGFTIAAYASAAGMVMASISITFSCEL